MMVSDYSNYIMSLGGAFSAGVGLGGVFFYGLWKTLGRVTTSESPALLLCGGAILRVSITMAGFYLVAPLNSEGQLERILLCLIGFLLARFAMTKVIRVQRGVSRASEPR